MADVEQARRGQRGAGADRRQRRYSGEQTEVEGLNLPIPDWVKEKFPSSEYELRWFVNTPDRMHNAHKRDWDPVEGVDPVPGAVDKNGTPREHVLSVKFKDWCEQDRDRREVARKEIEGQMRRGEGVPSVDKDAAGERLSRDVSYASESNRLS